MSHIQTLIRSGTQQRLARHFVLTVGERQRALSFMARMATHVSTLPLQPVSRTPARAREPITSIGFSWRGLEALGLPEPHRAAFRAKAPAFTAGAVLRAASRLADTGPSAAENWPDRFMPNAAHVLISFHADEENHLDELSRFWADRDAFTGWDDPLNGEQLKMADGRRCEHFGYAEDVAKVRVRWTQDDRQVHDADNEQIALGEFLLGHRNAAGFDPWKLGASPETAAFLENGSFGAMRVIEQDVAGFRDFVNRQAATFSQGREYVMAKLCGRWPNGMRIEAGQATAPAYEPESADGFDFKDDAKGHGCPFGAHIRRMNPRQDRVVPERRTRRLLRRSLPYGPSYEAAPDHSERGLLGHFFCASLEDQFEHLLAEWGNQNPMGPDNRGDARDPLIGQHEADGTTLEIPVPDGASRRISGFRPFVTTRGTMYAFYPSLQGLQALPRICAV
jgi:hypothetical protein